MTQTTLKIDGMMCGMCESHINDAIRKEFPVKKVTASLQLRKFEAAARTGFHFVEKSALRRSFLL